MARPCSRSVGSRLRCGKGRLSRFLGANGAGKTTTLKAISNLLGAERGSLRRGAITWQDQPTLGLDPADLVTRGIVQVLEGRHVFPQLTVEQNLPRWRLSAPAEPPQLAEDLERTMPRSRG